MFPPSPPLEELTVTKAPVLPPRPVVVEPPSSPLEVEPAAGAPPFAEPVLVVVAAPTPAPEVRVLPPPLHDATAAMSAVAHETEAQL